MRRRSALCVLVGGLVATLAIPPAGAQACGHTVVLTLPGVTWSDVARYRPPQLMSAIREGSVGSMSVRTIDVRTSYADGFATIGAGARIQGGLTAGGIAFGSTAASPQHDTHPPQLFQSVAAAGTPEMRILAQRAGYGAGPGALGAALESHGVSISAIGNADTGLPPSLAAGFGKWPLLAAMDRTGRVRRAAVSAGYLLRASRPFGVVTNPRREAGAIDVALDAPCSVVVVDGGDLIRADLNALVSGHRRPGLIRTALAESDALLARIEQRLEPRRDLLLIVSPTSPTVWPAAHLGVAIAVGPGFPPRTTLESASTRRVGFVTLPDVAPTVLSFRGFKQPAAMDGQPWYAVGGRDTGRIAAAIAADDEATLVDRLQPGISTAFVAFQVSVYFVALLLVARRERKRTPAARDVFRLCLEVIVLSVVAFPAATYLAGVVEAHQLGAWGLVTLLIAIDAALLAAVTVIWKNPLDRLLALTALTAGVLITDLFFGAPLELSTVFGYSPIVAGRFAGIGNIGFAVLASSSVLTGALVVHRWRGSRSALIFAAALFVVTVVADGLPALGSDVGGVIALVPALIVTWVLLAGKRPTPRTVLVAIVAVGLALAVFLVFDLSRPAANQTHLARLFDDFRARGASAISDTVERKVRANLQVFRSSVWTLSVPPAVAALAWLLLRPRGRWHLLVETYPRLRAGLVGALLVGLLGFAANDSGIIIPAVMLAFFVPLAVLLHLSLMDREAA